MRLITVNQSVASRRRVYFHLVAPDGITPALNEAAGQPQISLDGGAWTSTGISALVSMGSGRYYAELQQAVLGTAGSIIQTRYKSAATAESPGDSAQILAINPDDATGLGLQRLDAAVGSRLAATSYVLPDNAGIATATSQAQAAAAATSTVLQRIGSFSGTGAGTILGFLRALMRSDTAAELPTDVGGSFTSQLHSLQAIRNTPPLGTNLAVGNVSMISPVVSGGDLTVVQGDDYSAADGRALIWSADRWPNLSAAVAIECLYQRGDSTGIWSGEVVASGTGMQTVRCNVAGSQTAVLEPTASGSEYVFMVTATLAGGRKATLVRGRMRVVGRLARL